jgi:DNA-binding transcriptional MocR family regulator
LEDVLSNWDYGRGKKPHLMYTVTIGQNPTSGVLSLERRREIYAICQKYDVMIIEDDPYWYLQFPSANPNNPPFEPPSEHPAVAGMKWKKSGYQFLDSLVPSYLSIDVDGRVVRLDTFSKTVAPGCRLGWITAQPQIVERLLRITETTTQQPSGFVQSMIAELVVGPPGKEDSDVPGSSPPANGGMKDGSGWDIAGWVRWLEGLRGNYERRMNAMCDVLDSGKYLLKSGRRPSLDGLTERTETLFLDGVPAQTKTSLKEGEGAVEEKEWSVIEKTQIYDFVRPMGGMFVWIRFDFTTHPLASKVEHARLSRALWILWTTPEYRVLVAPGALFAPTEEIRDNVS